MTAARFSAAEVVAAWAAAAEGDAHVDSALAGLLQAGAWPVDPPEDWPVAAWDEALLELVALLQVRAVLDGVATCSSATSSSRASSHAATGQSSGGSTGHAPA